MYVSLRKFKQVNASLCKFGQVYSRLCKLMPVYANLYKFTEVCASLSCLVLFHQKNCSWNCNCRCVCKVFLPRKFFYQGWEWKRVTIMASFYFSSVWHLYNLAGRASWAWVPDEKTYVSKACAANSEIKLEIQILQQKTRPWLLVKSDMSDNWTCLIVRHVLLDLSDS